MPRAIWSGSITFGLVNIPVRMYSAIDEQDVRFHLLHTKDDSRIGYEKICKQENKRVADDEIQKAYEISKGKYVYVTEEDVAAAEGPRYRTITVCDFVPYEEIDPIYFERTYYLGPADGGEKVYALISKAMDDSGLAGIATYVMRDKQHLGCVRVRGGVITLAKMYFADEIRPLGEIKLKGVSVGKKELAMASDLIDRYTGSFDISKYRDDYRQDLLKVIRAKAKGKEVRGESGAGAERPDLMEALRASLQERSQAKPERRSTNGELSDLSKDELVKRARGQGVRGYSKMTKQQLAKALG